MTHLPFTTATKPTDSIYTDRLNAYRQSKPHPAGAVSRQRSPQQRDIFQRMPDHRKPWRPVKERRASDVLHDLVLHATSIYLTSLHATSLYTNTTQYSATCSACM